MSDWISVEDRLPEFKKPVLLFCIYKFKHFITVGFLDKIEETEKGQHRHFKGESENSGKIIYWMPLPEPPK